MEFIEGLSTLIATNNIWFQNFQLCPCYSAGDNFLHQKTLSFLPLAYISSGVIEYTVHIQKLLQSDRGGLELMTIISNSMCSKGEALSFENKRHIGLISYKFPLAHGDLFLYPRPKNKTNGSTSIFTFYCFLQGFFFFPLRSLLPRILLWWER